jgi:hypothetical protein
MRVRDEAYSHIGFVGFLGLEGFYCASPGD